MMNATYFTTILEALYHSAEESRVPVQATAFVLRIECGYKVVMRTQKVE